MNYSNDFNQLIFTLLLNFGVTIVLYLAVPFTLRYIFGKRYSQKEAKKIATINSICVFVLFTLYYIVIVGVGKVANVAPAFLWGSVAFYILRDKNKKEITLKNDDIPVRDMLVKEKIVTDNANVLSSPIVDEYNYKIRTYGKHSENNETASTNTYKAIAIVIIIGLIVGILFILGYAFISKINDLNIQIDTLKKEKEELSKEISDYAQQWLQDFNEINFWYNHAVIVPVNSNTYHAYGCKYCDLDNSFYIYSENDNRLKTMNACSYCRSGYHYERRN